MPAPVQSIERAAAVLKLLGSGPECLGLMDIANSLGLAKGTAHGILRTLCDVGFVEQDRGSGKYSVGSTFTDLRSGYLDANELRSRALNWADSLASHSGEAVRIGVLQRDSVLVVHHVFRPDDSPQSIDVGTLRPLHACALGKVLLAFSPGALAALAALAPRDLPRYTHRTVVARTQLDKELSEVRRCDWACDMDELVSGQAGIAAPVRDRGGLVVGAIGISGATDRLCSATGARRGELTVYVRDAARAITRELGARRW